MTDKKKMDKRRTLATIQNIYWSEKFIIREQDGVW